MSKFRIIDVMQGSEDWEQLRSGRPTASNFNRIVTPARGDYASGAITYACELVAQRIGAWTPPPPSFWMEWGTEHEPDAVATYERITGNETEEVGFILPNDTDAYGGSPDRFVDRNKVLEVKCPAPQTLIGYHVANVLPKEYKAQVQGLLWITGFETADFFAWHPELTPFLITVERDDKFIEKLAAAMQLFLADIEKVAGKVRRENHPTGADIHFGGEQ